jgi:hypothetical protein
MFIVMWFWTMTVPRRLREQYDLESVDAVVVEEVRRRLTGWQQTYAYALRKALMNGS